MKSKVLLIATVSLIISFISCGIEDAQKADVTKSQYTIINEETLTDIKTMIDIRLESEVDEEILYKIANELREDGRRKYQRVFIDYYLPDMEVGLISDFHLLMEEVQQLTQLPFQLLILTI